MNAREAPVDPIASWHDYVRVRDPALLDALVAEEAVFRSPAVHSPQVGKAATVTYLRAAMEVLGNESFRYLNEWRGERSAVLEFEAEIDGLTANGVDIIHWDEGGRIILFKVMVRPLKVLNRLVEKMAAELSRG
jgi:hypothetical protein